MNLSKILESKIISIIIISLIVVVLGVIVFKNAKDKDEEINITQTSKQVEVDVVQSVDANKQGINVVGKVSPMNFVDVVALSKGTVNGIFFELGDKVSQNQTLAFLKNSMTSTNLGTAHTSYLNMLNNLTVVRRSADEVIRQAETGISSAKESVRLAEVSLQSALNSLENSTSIQSQNNDNLRKNAVIVYDEYLNFVNSILNDANYIIAAEQGEQLAGLSISISAKNTQALVDAKNDYRITKNEYLSLNGSAPVEDNVLEYMKKMASLMAKLNLLMTDVVKVLDNTVENSTLSETTLLSQRSTYNGLLNSVVGMKTKVQTTINNLENIDLNNESLADNLQTAVDSATSQLELARTSYDNALVNLEKAKQAKSQQVLAAQISIDNSLGQLNINRDQFSDLTLRAPIDGSITKVAVDIGTEVSPGQLIAKISQVDEVKIEINLNSDDIYRVKVGDKVMINDKFEAEISSINPVADQSTRKVTAEIDFDNQDNLLIPGTTVNVSISGMEDVVDPSSKDAIFVPLRAVSVGQLASTVFIVEGDKARKVEVELGEQKGVFVEIKSGLNEGDVLVVEGNRILEDGDLLEIKNSL